LHRLLFGSSGATFIGCVQTFIGTPYHTGGETGTQTTLGEIASEIMVTTGPDAEACELDEIDEVSDADDEEAMV
jgi:hypothetical protein